MTDICRCLLKYRVNLKVEDTDWNTLVHLAAETGDTYGPPLIRMMLANGAPNHKKNKKGQSAFDLAVSRDHAGCALALLNRCEETPAKRFIVTACPCGTAF